MRRSSVFRRDGFVDPAPSELRVSDAVKKTSGEGEVFPLQNFFCNSAFVLIFVDLHRSQLHALK